MRRNKSKILAHSMIVKNSRLNRIKNRSVVSPNGTVCIMRGLGGIGDVLMATVTLREFKRENPKCKLIFAIDQTSTYDNTYYKLVENASFIDEIIDKRFVRKDRYSSFFDITSCCISEENSSIAPRPRIDIFSEVCKIKRIENHVPFYKEKENEALEADEVFAKHVNKKKFFIHTASNEGKRTWSIENTINLVRLIEEEYKDCVIFVSDFNNLYSGWSAFKNVVNVSALDIRKTASFIKRCDIFIGPDSGLMHLSAAVETKSLVIFGSIPPEARISYYPKHSSIRMDELGCIGCWYKPCPYNVKCMKDLTADRVFKKIKEIL